jgi:phosphonopyruvate decarboxylase
MIDARTFVEALRSAGFALFSGTPCSYLTPLINCVIGSPDAQYVGAANEGDAVAVAAGAELGGKRGVALFQNSGLGNAVNPLTSLTHTFRIPLLVLTTWRGQPGGPEDEPQHALMGAITPRLLELLQVPWEVVPSDAEALSPLLNRALAHLGEKGTPYALILPKGVVAPCALEDRPVEARAPAPEVRRQGATSPLDQDEALAAIVAGAGPDAALLATTGYTGRALYALGDRPNQLYMVGSMGCASSLGLGLARARPDVRVVVVDGDGAALMRLGALATLGHERPANLVHVLLDNGVHESTGGQATVSATADLAEVARACGYPRVVRAAGAGHLTEVLRQGEPALTFVHVRTRRRASAKLPRPKVTPPEVAERFRAWLRGRRR